MSDNRWHGGTVTRTEGDFLVESEKNQNERQSKLRRVRGRDRIR